MPGSSSRRQRERGPGSHGAGFHGTALHLDRYLVLFLTLCLAFGLVVAAPAAGRSDPPSVILEGSFTQGGLVMGRTMPGSEIRLDGTQLSPLPDGRFLLGFGREAGPRAELVVRLPDGRTTHQVLEIAAQDYDIQRIDGLPSAMVTPPEAVLRRIASDAAQVREARMILTEEPLFDSGWIWPLEGRITGVYGSQRILNGAPRQPHYGIDIAAPVGTPVRAAADGIVRLAEEDLYFTGGTILIDHGYGLNSVYSHLETLKVAVGDRIARGAVIGTVGATGRATGPHLDWRVNLFLTRLDPALLVPPPAPSGR